MAEMLSMDVVPMPLRLTACGLLVALSVSNRLPEAAPAPVGLKTMVTAQKPAGATGTEVEQVVPGAKMAKGAGAAMAEKVRLALPVLVRVTVCPPLVVPVVWLPNSRLAAERVPTAPVPTPVPARVIIWGLPGALSLMLTPAE